MDVMELERHRIGPAGQLELHGGQTPRACRVSRRHVCSELHRIRARDFEERRPSSYDAPSVAITSMTRPAIGARRTNAFPAARTTTASQGFITLSETRFRRAQT